MPRRKIGWLLGVASFLVAVWVTRHTTGLLRREPAVSNDLLTRPWVEEQLGLSGVVLETPWHLQSQAVPVPPQLSGKVREWTWLSHEADGLNVTAARVTYDPGLTTSLEGAAEGAIKNVRAMPGTAAVTPRQSATTLLGQPAIELEMRIEREKGETLEMHGIVVFRGSELIQVLAISRADQPLGARAWQRIRDSIRTRQAAWLSILNTLFPRRPEAAPPRRVPRGDTRRPYAS